MCYSMNVEHIIVFPKIVVRARTYNDNLNIMYVMMYTRDNKRQRYNIRGLLVLINLSAGGFCSLRVYILSPPCSLSLTGSLFICLDRSIPHYT